MEVLKVKPFNYPSTERPSGWGFMKRFLIGLYGDLYMDRLSLISTPWFSIKLHRIYRPDRQRDLHDHPWSFFSIILLGHYVEDTVKGIRRRRWWNWKRAEDRHSIIEVTRRPVWTLVICGRKRRKWGFWVDSGSRFVGWREYEKLMEA